MKSRIPVKLEPLAGGNLAASSPGGALERPADLSRGTDRRTRLADDVDGSARRGAKGGIPGNLLQI